MIIKEYNEQVLDKLSTHAIVKEYRKDPDPIFVYDLMLENELLASDRFIFAYTNVFNLTEEELLELNFNDTFLEETIDEEDNNNE